MSELADLERLPSNARALDLGCAVGRSSFELARHCAEVVGVDFSRRFVRAASELRRRGRVDYDRIEEGRLTRRAVARVPSDIPRERVTFRWGDAHALPAELGSFDIVLMANILDRLHDPDLALRRIGRHVRPGGQLVIATPNTWMATYTPVRNWLGGVRRGGRAIWSFDGMRRALRDDFRLATRRDMPFLIREHRRKFTWGVADGTVWVRRR